MRIPFSIVALVFLGFNRASAEPEIIRTAHEVHTLSLEQAYKGLPAALKGVVSAVNRGIGGGFFIDDGTGAVYVSSNFGQESVVEGDAVSLKGECQPGFFSPYIANGVWKKTGTLPLPHPKDIQIDEAMSGAEDDQYVRISCWVRDYYEQDRQTMLALSNGGFRFTGVFAEPGDLNLDTLIGAQVMITGVVSASTSESKYRRLVSVTFFPHLSSNIVIQTPAPPLDTDIVPLNKIGLYSISNSPGRRFCVQGVVTYTNEHSLFLSDSTGGIGISSNHDLSRFPIGDQVEATGFLENDQYLPKMEDARVVDLHQAGTITPKLLSAADLQQGDGHADWVQVNATLLEQSWHSINASGEAPRYEVNLSFESDKIVFTGSFFTTSNPSDLSLPEPGAVVTIHGLVISQADLSGATNGFRLLLNSPDNLQVLQPPPYFTTQRLLVVIVIVLSFSLLLLMVILLLFRKNSRLSLKLHEDRAIMIERARLSSELHDTIQQMLIGTSWQLDAALKGVLPSQEPVLQTLDLAKNYIKQTQAELRRSIWKLRHHSLEGFNLFSALRREAETISQGTNVNVNVSIPNGNESVSLNPQVEDNILRITQEAITNALKHANSPEIHLTVSIIGERLVLEVQDQGQGFSTSQNREGSDHFGLSNMKERADRIGANLTITSVPNHGTTVRLEFLIKK